MNNQIISITNQKLSAAKQHLICLERLDTNASKRLIAAYHESIVFQLYLACESFVQEIAADYQVGVPKQTSFNELAELLDRNEIPCVHCSQLALLQENRGSWLSWLHSRYAKCWELYEYSSPSEVLEKDLFAAGALIAIADVDKLSDEQRLKQCVEELGQVISDYRELMQQW